MSKDWEPTWTEAEGWHVDFTVAGRRVRRRLGIRDRGGKAIARRAAEAIWRKAWDDHLAPPAEVNPGTPFHTAARRYVEAGGSARYLERILTYAGPDTMAEDIDERWLLTAAAVLYPGCKPDTVRRHLRVPVNAVLNHHRGRRRQKGTDTRRVRWLTPEEADLLIAAAAQLTLPRHSKPEVQTLRKIAFMLGTGVRPGECFATEVKDWNPASKQWWIAGEAVGAGKTAAAARWVRLPDRAIEMVQPMPEVGRAFLTPYGQPIVLREGQGGQMQTAFNAARDAAGLGKDVTPYTLRHTWATWFYAQTRDFGALMDLGGWDRADTANRYRKIAPDDLPQRLLAHGWDFRTDWQKRVNPIPNIAQAIEK